jgi:hypothetical protein
MALILSTNAALPTARLSVQIGSRFISPRAIASANAASRLRLSVSVPGKPQQEGSVVAAVGDMKDPAAGAQIGWLGPRSSAYLPGDFLKGKNTVPEIACNIVR